MNEHRSHVVVLIGSPKGIEKSNSARLARSITDGLESAKWSCEWFHTHRALQSQDDWSAMAASMARADVILLAAPLYVDSLPAPVIETLHRLSATRSEWIPGGNPPRFLALLNCGFVEPHHNRFAQLMLQAFCEKMGFQWAGGISLGLSGMMAKPLRAALGRITEALLAETLIPDSVIAATSAPVMRPWVYMLGGNFMWRRQAKANGLQRKQLKAQPYKRA